MTVAVGRRPFGTKEEVEDLMALQLGDVAPDFEAETTEGPVAFTSGSATPGARHDRTSASCRSPALLRKPASSGAGTAR
jgi:hypothetical protein